MSKVITRGQEQLAVYFKAIGLTLAESLSLIANLWDERATVEMLEYLLETQDTDCDRVIKTALTISAKYPLPEDEEEE